MILGIDPGLRNCGWAVVDPCARVLELGLISSEPADGLDEAVDREQREAAQLEILLEVVRRHGVTAICGEALSFGGAPKARFLMAVSLCLSWGGILGLATALDLAVYSVPPKVWEHAVQHDADGAIDYDRVERDLAEYVTGLAREQLRAIPKAKRNHPLDGAALGMFGALRLSEVDVIRKRRLAAVATEVA